MTAPGVLVVSTRRVLPIGVIGTDDDIAGGIAPEHLPYYTTLSGTSMAAPHVAGVVALMLDANPALTPLKVKEILQATATPIPYTTWEAGAGYVDAYAAVKRAFRNPARGGGAAGAAPPQIAQLATSLNRGWG